ncbi:MAG: 1-acyl-sn-glycerol-3-phosphate acyltransferase [Caulobacteraceae bacterium]|nr:1-acyl-sn-glycerol-3-phosphate acyltransferase [Caulobacteraceae bacterium]
MIAFRSFLFVAAFYLWSATLAIGMIPLFLAPHRWIGAALGVWSRGNFVLLRVLCDVKVEIRGLEHAPKGPGLVAAKHQCMFDTMSLWHVLPGACFVLKKELILIPFFGWYSLKGKMIVVDREAHAKALRKLVRDAKDRLADGRQIVIFPEGTRTPPGETGDYKPGIAALYRELGVPVVPLATNSGVHWPAHGFIRKPGTIVFEFLPPIPAGLKRAEFMRELEGRIEPASAALLSL